jgi:hypothetical protein
VRLFRIVPWLFHRNGEQLQSLRKAWKRSFRDVGCPGLIVHDLRRTAVRNLQRARVSQSVAIKITGHLLDSVYRRYAIADEDMLREGAQRLSGLFSRTLVKSARKSCLSEWERLKMSSVSKGGGCSSVGRALDCGSSGRGFKSLHSPQISCCTTVLSTVRR